MSETIVRISEQDVEKLKGLFEPTDCPVCKNKGRFECHVFEGDRGTVVLPQSCWCFYGVIRTLNDSGCTMEELNRIISKDDLSKIGYVRILNALQ